MRVGLVVGIVGWSALALAADPAGEAGLEGTWVVQSATLDGKPLPEGRPAQFVFAGDRLTVTRTDGRTEKMTVRVNTSRTPKEMDFTPDKTEKGANVGAAIYELNGETLRICIGAPRPKAFTDADQPLLVLKRKK